MNLKKYIPIFIVSIFLVSTYINAIKTVEEGFLTVSTNTPFEPWEFKRGDEVIGVDIDVVRRIADYMGLGLKINEVSFDAITLELVNKKCDCAIAAMSSSPEKLKFVDFSDSYFSSNQAILVNSNSNINNVNNLKGKKVGAQLGTTGHGYCLERYDTHTYNSGVDAVLDLINNQIDAVVIDELPAKDLEQKNFGKIRMLDQFLFGEEYRIAVPKGNFELKQEINNVLSNLKSENFVRKKLEEYDRNKENYSSEFWDQFKINLIDQDRYKQIINGLGVTFKITFFALILGIILGFLTALAVLSKSKRMISKFFKFIAKSYVSLIRGTPVVCQLFIVYYLFFSPLGASKILCAIISFGVNSGAYVSEIIRSGILSVSSGQIEAGKALGLSNGQIMRSIIAPQALKNSIASLCNEFVQLIKETSVAGFIGITELTRVGDIIRGQTFSPAVPLLTVALIYFVIVLIVGFLISFIERRLRQSDNR